VVYSSDSVDYSFPVQGGKTATTNPPRYQLGFVTTDWHNSGPKDWTLDDLQKLSIAASLYLLVRYVDVGPKSFVCKSGSERPFDGSNPNPANPALEELWDFGGEPTGDYGQPMEHVSVAYQRPYPNANGDKGFPATSKDKQERAIVADKNPYWEPELDFENDITALTADSWIDFVGPIGWDEDGADTVPGFDTWHVKVGNSAAHEREGQNVAYGDCHVTFERRADCSVRDDNIYTNMLNRRGPWTENMRRKGSAGWRTADPIAGVSRSNRDSFLVNDGPSLHPNN
jgi:hypothetical protein